MSDKLQLETGDALLQEDGSSFILTIAAVDAPKTFPPLDVPARRASLAIASLTIGLSLLQSTLAPAAAATQSVTQSATPIQAKKPAPSWDPPNLLLTTLTPTTAEKPFTQGDWPVPPSRRLQWLVTTETRIGADDAVVAETGQPVSQFSTLMQSRRQAPPWTPPNLLQTTLTPVVAGDPVKPLDWPLPRVKASSLDLKTWTRSRPTYYTEPPLTLSARPIAWPNQLLKPVDVNRWTWLQSRPSYYTDAVATSQSVTQSNTPIQGKRPAPPWTPPNLLQNTLAPVAAGNPPIRQHNWPLPQSAPPRPVATLQFIGYYVFQVQQDPFVQGEWELPVQRKPAPQTWTQNLLETTLGAPAELPPIRQHIWPLPRGKDASLVLRTWTQPRPFYYTEPPLTLSARPLAWPNPLPRKPAPHTWTQSLLQGTLSTPAPINPPIRQHIWPVPPAKPVWQITSETRIGADDAVVVQPPFVQTDWPNPLLKASSLDLRTWIQPRPLFYVEPKPFSQTAWPNPQPIKPAPRDWTQRPAVPLATPEIRQYDWPNPRVRPAAFGLRTWIQPRPSFYTEPKPFAQLDWPTPKPFKPAPRDWTQSPDVPLGIPLRPLDWPLPRIKAASIDLKTWIQKRPAYYVDSTSSLVVTIHTVGLDVFQTVGAGLDIRPDPSAGLDVFATGTAGLDISATPSAGVSDRAAPAGLDIGQSLPAGLSDAT